MAITAVNQINFSSTSNGTSYPTGSRTPTANRYSIVSVVSTQNGGTSAIPTLSGNGLTWSQVATTLYNTTSTALRRVTVFVAKNGASPSAGAVTADFGATGQVGCLIFVDEVDGLDLTGTALQAIVQFKTGSVDSSGTSETITLDSAITSGNASYGCIAHQANEAHTPGDGHTELGDNSHDSPVNAGCTVFKSAGSQTVSASWSTSGRRGGIALELKAAASGHNVAVNQNSETDTAQAIAKQKAKAIAQNSETDTPQAIAPQRVYAVAQVVESDIAQGITFVSQQAVGQAVETDTAQAITSRKINAVAQITETDEAQPITPAKIVALNQVSETDTAQPITLAEEGVITETVNQVQETDAAQPITVRKIVLVAQVSETDLAQSLFPAHRVAVAQVIETDVVQGIAVAKRKAVVQAFETDIAQSITLAGPIVVVVGQVQEIETALAITPPILSIDVTELHLHSRALAFTLDTRSTDLTAHARARAMTLESL